MPDHPRRRGRSPGRSRATPCSTTTARTGPQPVDKQAGSWIRPLARSLDPFEGESLGGYLLRLSCRLCLSPIRLARQIVSPKTRLSRSLLLDLDVAAFAHATRLTAGEAAALTLIPWAS